jgi:hypothetical protein
MTGHPPSCSREKVMAKFPENLQMRVGMRIFLLSWGVIACEIPILFCLGFQPGWAKKLSENRRNAFCLKEIISR